MSPAARRASGAGRLLLAGSLWSTLGENNTYYYSRVICATVRIRWFGVSASVMRSVYACALIYSCIICIRYISLSIHVCVHVHTCLCACDCICA